MTVALLEGNYLAGDESFSDRERIVTEFIVKPSVEYPNTKVKGIVTARQVSKRVSCSLSNHPQGKRKKTKISGDEEETQVENSD